MTDALDLLQHCPICGRTMLITLDGLICPPCNFLYESKVGESLLQTCERYNADYETIRTEIEKD